MAVTPVNPTRYVRGSSVNRITTDIENKAGLPDKLRGLVNTKTKEYYTEATATVFAEVTNAAGSVTMAQQQLDYISPGIWDYEAPASAWATGTGDWAVQGWVYGPSGTGDTELAEFFYTAKERNSP